MAHQWPVPIEGENCRVRLQNGPNLRMAYYSFRVSSRELNLLILVETGGCGCNALRYRLKRAPMVIHCCNCESCQRETGSAFAVNAIIEADQIELLPGARQPSAESDSDKDEIIKPKLFLMPSRSGLGQLVARCPRCFVAVWSHYPGAGPWVSFIRCGTLDKSSVDGTSIKELLRPDLYIYTSFKQPWVVYPTAAIENGKVMDEYYKSKEEHWSEEALARFGTTREKTQEWIDSGRPWDVLGDVVDLR